MMERRLLPTPPNWRRWAKNPLLGKQALLPGQTASFQNYVTYCKGINGIMIDVAGLKADSLSATDFVFQFGNGGNPSAWPEVAVPPVVSVDRGKGLGGSDRITLIWPNNAIANGNWLQVTVKKESTGLANSDVFYFGLALGETGNSAQDAVITADDVVLTRNQHSLWSRVGIDDPCDFNRDGLVSSLDAALCRLGGSGGVPLALFSAPSIQVIEAGGAEVGPSEPTPMGGGLGQEVTAVLPDHLVSPPTGATLEEMVYWDLVSTADVLGCQQVRPAGKTGGALDAALAQLMAILEQPL